MDCGRDEATMAAKNLLQTTVLELPKSHLSDLFHHVSLFFELVLTSLSIFDQTLQTSTTLAVVNDVRVRSYPWAGLGVGFRGGKGGKKASRLRIGSWNIGTLTGKSIELGKILQKRKINIACVQETRWKGTRARDVDGFKLWYSGSVRGRFEPGCKKQFWDDLDKMVRSIPHAEKLFIGGDFNNHIGASAGGYDDVHGGYCFGDRNEGGNSLLEFARAFDLVIANSSFPMREEHLVTFRNLMGKTQIDYLLCRKCDKGLCTDCKVIPSEHLTTLHRLLVMDLKIKRSRRKRARCRQLKIKWGNLTKEKLRS
ncbi:uncharacterized protein [Nicotiana sylvestris]|uniref:uncharacterized protein n=1 Tax=Nicotiana sylvestris TaxID=4096 RepID=UPI00388C8BD4